MTMPRPDSEEDRYRWEVSGQRRRLLTGTWGPDALDREAAFYDASVREHLPPAELSRNPFLSLCTQVTTLYDTPGSVSAGDDADEDELERLIPETWWATMQERLRFQRGQNEALIRLDIRGGADVPDLERRLTYRVVYADTVADVATDPDDGARLLRISELRERTRPGTTRCEWTWETFDLSDPAAPVFRIEAIRQTPSGTERVDATIEYAGSNAYPYYEAGAPVMPYVLAHVRIGSHTWDPDTGVEIVSGTLTTAALWTMWVGGVRDNASPTRYARDLDILAQQVSGGSLGVSTQIVRHDPSTIMQVRSRGQTAGDLGQLPATMEPKGAAEAIGIFVDGLGASWDISPDDVTPGSSGYAMVLSRAGQRRARTRLIPPCRLADQLILATGARLLRGHGGAVSLPTDPSEYQITYTEIETSPEEVKATVEVVTALRDAGLMTRRMGLERVYPGLTPEQYEAIEEALDEEAAAKTAKAPAVAPPPMDRPAAPDATEQPESSTAGEPVEPPDPEAADG